MAKAAMRTTRSRLEDGESFGPMAAYQRLIAQDEFWESWDGGVAENKAISEMPAPYAINALHKLARWQERLFTGSTAKQYEEARAKMFESALASALIEQALGEFYQGTFLVQLPPHVDDIIQQGADNLDRILSRVTPDFEEELLEVSITGAVELEANAHESIGARARILYRVLAEGITFPTTTEAS